MENKYKIVVHDPMRIVNNPERTEREFDSGTMFRFEINDIMYRIKIDKIEGAIKIEKVGRGSMRGRVDRISILPETANSFLIR